MYGYVTNTVIVTCGCVNSQRLGLKQRRIQGGGGALGAEAPPFIFIGFT